MEKTNDLSLLSLLMLGAMLNGENREEEPKQVEENTEVRFKNPVRVGDCLEIIGSKDEKTTIVRLNGSESYVPIDAWSNDILLQLCIACLED